MGNNIEATSERNICKRRYSNGDVYEGQFWFDMRHGKGKYLFVCGDQYEVEYQDHQRQGTGRYTYANGDFYEGEWNKNVPHGKGIFSWSDGFKIEGKFLEGALDGVILRTLPNGQVRKEVWVEKCLIRETLLKTHKLGPELRHTNQRCMQR